MIALITGGSGCGKSYYAERLAVRLAAGGALYYIATMDAYDDECRRRVARHRAQRAGLGFETIEQPLALGELRLQQGATAIIECLPTLLSNEMFLDGGDPARIVAGIAGLARDLGNLVIVTNDVSSDGQTYDESTNEYIKLLAEVNIAAARIAERVVEVVYSIPCKVKGELP